MFEKVLAISGKPGLYTLVSHSQRGLVVETLDEKKRRMPIFGTDKVIALTDIAMYTDNEEVPLRQVMANVKAFAQSQPVQIDHRNATAQQLQEFMAQALPNYDRDRVHGSDIKKLVQWYNLLVTNGVTDFEMPAPEAGDEATPEAPKAE